MHVSMRVTAWTRNWFRAGGGRRVFMRGGEVESSTGPICRLQISADMPCARLPWSPLLRHMLVHDLIVRIIAKDVSGRKRRVQREWFLRPYPLGRASGRAPHASQTPTVTWSQAWARFHRGDQSERAPTHGRFQLRTFAVRLHSQASAVEIVKCSPSRARVERLRRSAKSRRACY